MSENINMELKRTTYQDNGIFSELTCDGECLAITLEHSYAKVPKLPPGEYTCVRGTHQLEHGGPFETFEITGVPGHKGILFHVGNFNNDSDGCVLLGEASRLDAGLITNSKKVFAEFMEKLTGIDSFQLTVVA